MTTTAAQMTRDDASKLFLSHLADSVSTVYFHEACMEEMRENAQTNSDLSECLKILGDDVNQYTHSVIVELYGNTATTGVLPSPTH